MSLRPPCMIHSAFKALCGSHWPPSGSVTPGASHRHSPPPALSCYNGITCLYVILRTQGDHQLSNLMSLWFVNDKIPLSFTVTHWRWLALAIKMNLSHPDHAGVSSWRLTSHWRRSKSLHSQTIMSRSLGAECWYTHSTNYVLGKDLPLFSLNFNFLVCKLGIVLTW